MDKPKIVAPGANETTFCTLIDVYYNSILMCLPSLEEIDPQFFNAEILEQSLKPFLETLQTQIKARHLSLYGPPINVRDDRFGRVN